MRYTALALLLLAVPLAYAQEAGPVYGWVREGAALRSRPEPGALAGRQGAASRVRVLGIEGTYLRVQPERGAPVYVHVRDVLERAPAGDATAHSAPSAERRGRIGERQDREDRKSVV